MDDTISAIATALGVGSIGVIRISGPHSLAIADRLFDGREKLGKENARKLLYGHIRDGKGQVVECSASAAASTSSTPRCRPSARRSRAS